MSTTRHCRLSKATTRPTPAPAVMRDKVDMSDNGNVDISDKGSMGMSDNGNADM